MEKDAFEVMLKKHEKKKWIEIVDTYQEVYNWLISSPVAEDMIVSQVKYLDIFLDDVKLNPRKFLDLSGTGARDLTEKKCEEYSSAGDHSKMNQVKYSVKSFYNSSHKEDGERIYFSKRHKISGCN